LFVLRLNDVYVIEQDTQNPAIALVSNARPAKTDRVGKAKKEASTATI